MKLSDAKPIHLLMSAWVLSVLGWMPLTSWLNADPLALVDHPLMEYQILRAREFFALFGRPWGYDPFFSAGYPLTFVWNSNVILQLFGLLLPFLSPAAVSKLFILLVSVAFPFCMQRTARAFGLSPTVSYAVFVGTLLLFVTEAGWFWIYLGMHSGLAAFFVAFLAVASVRRYSEAPSFGRGAGVALFCGLAVLFHKTNVVVLGVAFAAWFVAPPVGRRRNVFGWTTYAALGVLLVNLFWILPMLSQLDHKSIWPDTLPRKNFSPTLLLHDWLGWRMAGSQANFDPPVAFMLFRWLFTFGAMGGLWRLRKWDVKLARFLTAWIVLLAGWVYFGYLIPGAEHANPYRYLIFLRYLVLLPAAVGWVALWREAIRRFPYPNAMRWGAAVALTVVALGTGLLTRTLFPLQRLSEGPAAGIEAALEALEKATDPNARILFEQSDTTRTDLPSGYDYAMVQLGARSKRAMANPVYPFLLTDYHPVRLVQGNLNGAPLGQWLGPNADALAKLASDYNVGAIVCWSAPCREALEGFADRFQRMVEVGPYRVAVLHDRPGWFIQGSGEVALEPGRVGLADLKAQERRVVLRMHYVEGMRASPSGEIGPYEIEGDPNPFVEIVDPPPKLWILY